MEPSGAPDPSTDHDLPRTWAETRARWSGADWLAVISIPLIFGVGWLTTSVLGISRPVVVADALVRVALCAGLLWIYRPLLARHWARFRERLWPNVGLVVAGAIVAQIVIGLVRAVVPTPDSGKEQISLIDPAKAHGWDILILFVAVLGPLAIVMIEEAVFRHTLLVKLPFWGNRALAVVAIVVNGALFGAIHYYNFGSLAGTVPYMVVGMLLNLVYLWRRNLWHVMLIHLVNNAVLSLGGLVLVLLLRDAMG